MSERRIACPDAELLAGLIENRLDTATRARVELHVATCGDCLDAVAAALPSADEAVGGTTVAAPAASSATSRSDTPRTRWQLRGALAAGLVLAASTLVAYGGARLVTIAVARALASRASSALGTPVGVGDLAVALDRNAGWLVVTLDDVAIGAGSIDASAIDAVELSVALSGLLQGHLITERIRLVAPRLHFTLGDPNGPPISPSTDVEHLAVLAALVPLEIADGVLVVDDRRGAVMRIENVHGTLMPSGDVVSVGLTGTVAGAGDVGAGGTLDLDAGGAIEIGLRARGLERASTIAPLAGMIDAHGNLDARVGGTIASPRLLPNE